MTPTDDRPDSGERGAKPCPFCGTEIGEIDTGKGRQGDREFYVVACPYCGADGPDMETEEEAFAAWNIRADRPSSTEEWEGGERWDGQKRKTTSDALFRFIRDDVSGGGAAAIRRFCDSLTLALERSLRRPDPSTSSEGPKEWSQCVECDEPFARQAGEAWVVCLDCRDAAPTESGEDWLTRLEEHIEACKTVRGYSDSPDVEDVERAVEEIRRLRTTRTESLYKHFSGEDIALYALSMLAEDYGFDVEMALHNALNEMNEARIRNEDAALDEEGGDG